MNGDSRRAEVLKKISPELKSLRSLEKKQQKVAADILQEMFADLADTPTAPDDAPDHFQIYLSLYLLSNGPSRWYVYFTGSLSAIHLFLIY